MNLKEKLLEENKNLELKLNEMKTKIDFLPNKYYFNRLGYILSIVGSYTSYDVLISKDDVNWVKIKEFQFKDLAVEYVWWRKWLNDIRGKELC